MVPAFRLQEVSTRLARIFENNPQWNYRLIGIIFSRPESHLFDSDSLNYYNCRSDNYIDFFFAGFTSVINSGTPDCNLKWLFDPNEFNKFRQEFERITSWHYSGSIDLLLCNASRYDQENGFIDLSNIFYFDLEKMLQNRTIISINRFFESIFIYSEKPDLGNPAAHFVSQQDNEVIKYLALKFLKGLIKKMFGMEQIDANFVKNVAIIT